MINSEHKINLITNNFYISNCKDQYYFFLHIKIAEHNIEVLYWKSMQLLYL